MFQQTKRPLGVSLQSTIRHNQIKIITIDEFHMVNKFDIIVSPRVNKHNQIMYTIRVWFKYSQPSQSLPMHIYIDPHKTQLTIIKACNVIDFSRCMVPLDSRDNFIIWSKSTPLFTFLIWLNMTMMHGLQVRLDNTPNTNYVITKVHLQLYFFINQHYRHYQVLRSTQSTSHISNRSHHHIIKSKPPKESSLKITSFALKEHHRFKFIFHNKYEQLSTSCYSSSQTPNPHQFILILLYKYEFEVSYKLSDHKVLIRQSLSMFM